MSNEERLTLNIYLEGLYQAMQIGDIVYEPKHSSELYDLINKLLEENKKYKEVIDTLDFIKARAKQGASQETINICAINFVNSYIKEVEHE